MQIVDHYEDDFSVDYFDIDLQLGGYAVINPTINFTASIRDTTGETLDQEIDYVGRGDVRVSGWVQWEKLDQFGTEYALPQAGGAHVTIGQIATNPATTGNLDFNQAASFDTYLPTKNVNLTTPHVSYVAIEAVFEVAATDPEGQASLLLGGVAGFVIVFDEEGADLMNASGYDVEPNVTYLSLAVSVSIIEFDFLGPAITMSDATKLTVSYSPDEFLVEAEGESISLTVKEFNALLTLSPAYNGLTWGTLFTPMPAGSTYTAPPTVGAGITACGVDLRFKEWGFDFGSTPTTVTASTGASGSIRRASLPQNIQTAGLLDTGLIG